MVDLRENVPGGHTNDIYVPDVRSASLTPNLNSAAVKLGYLVTDYARKRSEPLFRAAVRSSLAVRSLRKVADARGPLLSC